MDLYAMRDSRRISALAGIGLSAAMIGVTLVTLADFNGAFSSDVDVTARLPENGAVVSVNSAVNYRGVEVGEVVDAPQADADGQVTVNLRLDHDRIAGLPSNVVAVVGPLSVFGNQYVNLVPDPGAEAQASGPLEAGAVIPSADDTSTPSLESTFIALDDVLDNIHPAQLNAGLSGLSQALAGRGTSLGETLVSADSYLTDMLALWPTLVDDLQEFAPFATTLAASTPEFLDLLKNATVTADTLTENRDGFGSLMSNGGRVSNQVAALIQQTMAPYAHTVAGADDLFKALSQSPQLIGRLLTGIEAFSGAWSTAMDSNAVSISAAKLRVGDPAALALAAVAGKNVAGLLEQAVDGDLVNPRTYGAGDCPRYGSVSGNCGGAR